MELTFCIKMKSEGPKRAGIFFGSWQGGVGADEQGGERVEDIRDA